MALAAPAEKGGFFYAGDVLYCEASNLNRHRRANLTELKAHFNGKDTDSNRPAHWYEAQLLHYGLPPSKVKGTAHKRLFDAVMKGGLTVPSHIQKIETDLKKEWTKRERETKKMVKESAAAAAAAAAAPKKSTKRKVDQVSTSTNVSVNVSFQVSSTGQVMLPAARPAAKKAKTATATKATATPKGLKSTMTKAATTKAIQSKATPSKAPKATMPKAAMPKAATKAAPLSKPAKPIAKGKTTPKQTARRSRPFGSDTAPSFADAPPPYTEYDTSRGSSSQAPYQHSIPTQPKLGLLNGRYTVRSRDLEDAFPDECDTDLGLIATIDGNTLWLKFDFGAAVGIMELLKPRGVFEGRRELVWRGSATDEYGEMTPVDRQDADSENWVEFLGDGYVEGSISWDGYRSYQFEAERLPGESMYSEISPWEMRRLYQDYAHGYLAVE